MLAYNHSFWFSGSPLDAPLCKEEARFNMAVPFAAGTGRGEQSVHWRYNTYAHFSRFRPRRDSNAGDFVK